MGLMLQSNLRGLSPANSAQSQVGTGTGPAILYSHALIEMRHRITEMLFKVPLLIFLAAG